MNQLALENMTPPTKCREQIRCALWKSPTAGMAKNYIQGNVVILPKAYAKDFMQYCLNNPKPCPLLGISSAGCRSLDCLGNDIDLARDIPKYCLFNDGVLTGHVIDIVDYWRDDLVTFVLGCSFSFEHELQASGYAMRHIDCQQNVAMYKTNIKTVPSTKFSGNLVVSMRPIKPEALDEVYHICSSYPFAHGTPIHVGNPSAIGIDNLQQPDYGETLVIKNDETPVFWACGVTTQEALSNAKLAFHITHAPGHMLITDLKKFSSQDAIDVLQGFYAPH